MHFVTRKKCNTNLVIVKPKKTVTTQEKNATQAKHVFKTIMHGRRNKGTQKRRNCTCNSHQTWPTDPTMKKSKNRFPDQIFLNKKLENLIGRLRVRFHFQH